MTARELREMQTKTQLEMFYRLSVEDAIQVLHFLLEPPKEKKEEDCQG